LFVGWISRSNGIPCNAKDFVIPKETLVNPMVWKTTSKCIISFEGSKIALGPGLKHFDWILCDRLTSAVGAVHANSPSDADFVIGGSSVLKNGIDMLYFLDLAEYHLLTNGAAKNTW
jgi:hypothetical protein